MFILKDGEGMKLWLEKVWSKRPGGLLQKPSLLVCDQFKTHVTESTKRLATKLKTHLTVILGGLPYFPVHKMHRDFFVRNFRKK